MTTQFKYTKLITTLFFTFISLPALATTYTVTKTADSKDGSCDSADCSLREAIAAANVDVAAPHTIEFAVPATDANCSATGVCTFSPTIGLPALTKSMTINGYSQSGATENTNDFPAALNTAIKIQISGASTSNGTDGFVVNAANVTFKGLAIFGFPATTTPYSAHGIQTLNNVGVTGLKVQGCFIGVQADGDTVSANKGNGVYISGIRNTGSFIGGDGDGINEAGERNIISGNENFGIWIQGSSTTVAGNFIGVDKDGDTDLGNRWVGVYDAIGSNTITGNLISGNNTHGIRVASGSNTVISENIIGLGADGATAVKNSGHGVLTTTTGTGISITDNVISGNGGSSSYANVALSNSSNTVSGNLIGMSTDGASVVASTAQGVLIAGNNNLIQDNEIAGHAYAGISVTAGIGNQFIGNSFHDNTGSPIQLAAGTNNNKSAPSIDSQNGTVILGTSAAGDTVEVYAANADLEGQTSLGAATADTSGNWQFTSSDGYAGSVLVVLATDTTNGTSAFSSAYTVVAEAGDTATNTAPTANEASVTTAEDTAVSFNLSASDAESTDLSYSITASPTHGTVSLVGNAATYTPNADFYGSDSFTYTVSDGELSATTTVTLTVTAINDAPSIADLNLTTNEDTTATLTFSGTDAEGDAITYELVSNTTQGTMTLGGETATFVPTANLNGSDSFTYRAFDGTDYSETKTIYINITPVNDAPEAEDMTSTTIVNEAVTLELGGTDPDTDDDLDYEFNSDNVTYNGSDYVYTPDTDVDGTDSFVYTVCDDEVCDNGTVTITLLASSDCYQTIPESLSNSDVIIGEFGYFTPIDENYRAGRRVSVTIYIYNESEQTERTVTTSTNDGGCYYASFDSQTEEVIETIYLASSSSNDTRSDGSLQNEPDGVTPDYCNGASWSTYHGATFESFGPCFIGNIAHWYAFGETNVPVNSVSLVVDAVDADSSVGFHTLDVALSSIELVCSADPDHDLGHVTIAQDWFADCDNDDYGCYQSSTNTIFYGENDLISDERITYTIAHEFGHHLQHESYTDRDNNIYNNRLSSVSHEYSDLIDGRMALMEGFAGGFGDYIVEQYFGTSYHDFDSSLDPGAGIAKEANVAYTIYQLIQTDGYATIHQVYQDDMPTTPVFQTLHSFGYYYSQRGGSVSPFEDVGIPAASLDDLYDADNNIGQSLGSFYALYPRISYMSGGASEYETSPDGGDNYCMYDWDGDAYRYCYLSYHKDYDDAVIFVENQEYDYIYWPYLMYDFPDRNSTMAADLTPNHTVPQHDLISFASSDTYKESAAGASRWFVVDGNQFRFGCEEFTGGPCASGGVLQLTIADDSQNGDRCAEDLNLVAYQNGDVYAQASGYCPSIDISADGTYIVEVYSTDVTRDVACFSFMDEHYCEENL